MTTNQVPRMTVFASYGHGWRQFMRHFLNLFLVSLVVGIASAPISMTAGWAEQPAMFAGPLFALFSMAYGLLVLPVIKYGGDWLVLKFVRDEPGDIGDIIDGFRNNYLSIVLASLLVFAIVGFGFVLLVVPGIIFLCRLVFVPYLVMDKQLDPVAAVEKSWSMTRGHGFRVFGMFLLAIPVCMLGLLLFGIGVFFALIWVGTAFASLYYAIDADEQSRLNGNGNGNGGGHGRAENGLAESGVEYGASSEGFGASG